jgi:hypothetical protein
LLTVLSCLFSIVHPTLTLLILRNIIEVGLIVTLQQSFLKIIDALWIKTEIV